MADVDEIIDYIKSLKKRFDKDLFQSKIEELSFAVDNTGLEYDDFHTLFKLWLNLNIPITKWVNLGVCLVPHTKVSSNTVEYSLRWILANYDNQTSFSRIGFLLDWLTAAMDCDCIDMSTLDSGYELFYTMLTFEVLTAHAVKLVYTLTKPRDVTRRRVLELFDYAKKREGKKNMYRQLQVLLGLFKSYKPECVPEDIPSISIHTSFKKINVTLLERFKNCQIRHNSTSKERQHLFWINTINSESGRNKKADPLVPNMEFSNVGSKQYADKEEEKNYLDFSDPVSLLHYSVHHSVSRPARLRALLCNETGFMILAVATDEEHAFLSHDLHNLLLNCFLDISPHSHMEKQDLLRRLVVLQNTFLQGIPVVTRFLAQFLPFWNEKDFFGEILDLVEWVNVDSVEHVTSILDSLTKIYCRAQPIEQCAILKSLTAMYSNLACGNSKYQQVFMSMQSSESCYDNILMTVESKIHDICNKGLQISPGDMRVLYSGVGAAVRCARAAALHGRSASAPRLLPLAAPLLAPSAAAIDKVAELIMLYKQIFSTMKAKKGKKDEQYVEQVQILKAYTADFISCFEEDFLTERKKGLIFSKLHPQLVSKLSSLIPDADAKLSVRNHLAFAPYTYTQLQAIDHMEADNRLWFDTVIDPEFSNLSAFVGKAMPEMR